MNGTEYVIEQLGEALHASHQLIAQQARRIAELEAQIATGDNQLDGAPSPRRVDAEAIRPPATGLVGL